LGRITPAFRCSTFGAGELLVPLQHVLGPPASADMLASLRATLPQAAQDLEGFYTRHDGLVLFADRLLRAAGIEIYPISMWAASTRRFRKWKPRGRLTAADDPYGVWGGVAIGEVPGSGNYFVVPKKGPYSAQIFYADHERGWDRPFAETFDAFLLRMLADPVALLMHELGGFAICSDGRSSMQWSPIEYIEDARSIHTEAPPAAPRPESAFRLSETELIAAVRSRGSDDALRTDRRCGRSDLYASMFDARGRARGKRFVPRSRA
jgi:hypothetical protein